MDGTDPDDPTIGVSYRVCCATCAAHMMSEMDEHLEQEFSGPTVLVMGVIN